MKKLILTTLLSFALFGFTAEHSLPQILSETYVYICDSAGATKYHYKKDCRGLNACKSEVKRVTLSDAKSKGKKTLCGWED